MLINEYYNKFHFLDIGIQPNSNGQEGSIHRKGICGGLYLDFNDFCTINYKGVLVRTLNNHVLKPYSEEKIELIISEKFLKFITKYEIIK